MQRSPVRTVGLLVAAVAVALLGVMGMRVAWAVDPQLVIRQLDGGSRSYPVREIEWIRFEGDTVMVVVPAGSDLFPLGTIGRIEFEWDQVTAVIAGEAAGLAGSLHLLPNQPNPFSPDTHVMFDLPRSGPVKVKVYGVDGRFIRTLVDEIRPAGRQAAPWNGRDEAGRRVASGVYFCRLSAPGIEETRKMILLR